METANVSSHVCVCSAGKTHGWRSCGVFRSRSVEGNNGNGCEIDGGTDGGSVCVFAKTGGMAYESLIHQFQTCHAPPYVEYE